MGLAAFAALVLVHAAACANGPAPDPGPRTLRVPADLPTIDAAVGAARPGDTILLAPGRYTGGTVIPADRPDITIRGEDRNRVEFDGEDTGRVGLEILADGVSVENLTVHSFRGDGVVWKAVRGFAARYLTVWNVGGYGIYAIGSTGGLVEHSLVSGAGDSGYYVGECRACDTTVRLVEARLSAIGYSGTNASGVVVRDSLWDRNGTGILPNSFDQEANPPQSGGEVFGNTVRASGSIPTPATDPLGGLTGIGIGIAGGVDNDVHDNDVEGSDRFGIALFSTVQPEDRTWDPARNAVRDNEVRESGIADLALARGVGPGNCFAGNRFDSSLPDGIEVAFPCDSSGEVGKGDPLVARELVIPTPLALARSGPRPPYTSMPEPEPQPRMPSGSGGPSGPATPSGPAADATAAARPTGAVRGLARRAAVP